MTAPLPPFRLRTPGERRAWLQGWLSCWDHIAKEADLAGNLPAMAKTLVHAFRKQLEELREEENRCKSTSQPRTTT